MKRSIQRLSLAIGLLLAGAASPVLAQQPPLTLERAIELAQDQGYQAQAAKATRAAARFRDQAFYSRLLPQFSLGGTIPAYNRSIIQVLQPDGSTLFRPQDQTNAALTMQVTQKLPLTGGDLSFTSSLARLKVSGDQAFDSWSSTPFQIALRQDIFRPNTLVWDRREQAVRGELTERQFLETREDIALSTSSLFFDAYAAKMGLANAVTNAAVNDTLYTLNKGRFEVGKIGENDLLQSELALLRARASVDGARLENDRALAALRLAVNLQTVAPLEIAVTTTVPDFDADTTRAVVEALRNRATVSDAELQDVQANRRVTEAKLQNGMGATVQASYGFNATGDAASLAYRNLLEARQFSLAVSLPLWQWGAHKENVQAAQADRARVTSLNKANLDQTAQDAHFAALQLSQAKRTLTISAKADTVAGKRFEVALNRYVIGRITIDNLYIAQSEKDQALAQFILALRGYWQAYYRLRKLTLFDFAQGKPIN